MSTIKHKTRTIRVCLVSIMLTLALVSLRTSLARPSAQAQKASGVTYSSKRMADGKQWMTQNLAVNTVPSYCYDDLEKNCSQYGRLYTWESARRVCQSLGDGWRLPTDDEWRLLAKGYCGVSEDSDDKGKSAFKALFSGGSSGFNALLGGGRSDDGKYARMEAHGFYWTASESDQESKSDPASESDPSRGWFYNFARGGQALHRQSLGEKQRAFSVRCIRD